MRRSMHQPPAGGEVHLSEPVSIADGDAGKGSRTDLPRCVKYYYPAVLLWMKFREEWFSRLSRIAPDGVVSISYERMVRCAGTELGHFAAALGLGGRSLCPRVS